MRLLRRLAATSVITTALLALTSVLLTPRANAKPFLQETACLAESAPLDAPLNIDSVSPAQILTWTWLVTNTSAEPCTWGPTDQTSVTIKLSASDLRRGFSWSPQEFDRVYAAEQSLVVTLSVTAPNESGTYTTSWGLYVGAVNLMPSLEASFTVTEILSVTVPALESQVPVPSPSAEPTRAANTPNPTLTPIASIPAPVPTLGAAAVMTQSSQPTVLPSATQTGLVVPVTPVSSNESNLLDAPIIIGAVVSVLALILLVFALIRRGRKPTASPVSKPVKPVKPKGGVQPSEPEVAQKCPHCQTPNKPTAKFCKSCGKPLQPTAVTQKQAAITKPLSQTTPVPSGADTLTLPALEKGTVLGPEGQQYRILDVVHTSKQLNRYLAESVQALIYCPQCGKANPGDSKFCEECGTPFANVSAYVSRYRLKEAARPERIGNEYTLAGWNLVHPNVLPPRLAFEDKGKCYVAVDEQTWGTALQAVPPQDLSLVTGWGIGLADGLAYLHSLRVIVGEIKGNEVALNQKMAAWAEFENARLITPDDWGHNGTTLIAADVRQLAGLLYRLITSQTQFEPNHRALTPKANAIFMRALGDMGYQTAAEFAQGLRDIESSIRRPGGLDIHAARLSDVGQERDLDEDSILTLELGQVYRSASRPLGVYAVADGMGGHEGGDVASRLAIRAIARRAIEGLVKPHLEESTTSIDFEKWIKEAVQDANQAVLTRRKAARTDMGTTLVMAVIDNDTAHIGHIGDSRAYLLRDTHLQPLTVDHSLVERLVATGQIKPEEAATHPQRNVIYKNIGDKAQIEPDIRQVKIQPGDVLLLCCDGLSGEVSDADMGNIILNSPSLPVACRELVRAANLAGGHDNISVVLISVWAIE